MFNTIYARRCKDPCQAGSISLLAPSVPQRTTLYIDAGTSTTSTTTTTTSTTTTTTVFVAPVGHAAGQEKESDISGMILMSAGITAGVGWCFLLLCAGLYWWFGRRKRVSPEENSRRPEPVNA